MVRAYEILEKKFWAGVNADEKGVNKKFTGDLNCRSYATFSMSSQNRILLDAARWLDAA